jgi:hypothetical protein
MIDAFGHEGIKPRASIQPPCEFDAASVGGGHHPE